MHLLSQPHCRHSREKKAASLYQIFIPFDVNGKSASGKNNKEKNKHLIFLGIALPTYKGLHTGLVLYKLTCKRSFLRYGRKDQLVSKWDDFLQNIYKEPHEHHGTQVSSEYIFIR